MRASNFELDAYFRRIKFDGLVEMNANFLHRMMQAQLFAVPFENLDVQAGKVVSFKSEDIVEKIVVQKRGGYCYEVNALFAMALEALAIPYQFVAARPMFYPMRRPKTHMALVVTLGRERYLCDLGFGSYGIRAPINLEQLDSEIEQYPDLFKLSRHEQEGYLLQALVSGEWKNQYAFDLSVWEWIDFLPANYLNSTHPDAVFVQKILIIQHQAEGRDILFGNTFKQIRHQTTEEKTLNDSDVHQLLVNHFQLPNLAELTL